MMYTDAKPQINEEGSLRRRYLYNGVIIIILYL
jgi:hypothetical protein